jgi:hypothetical protein
MPQLSTTGGPAEPLLRPYNRSVKLVSDFNYSGAISFSDGQVGLFWPTPLVRCLFIAPVPDSSRDLAVALASNAAPKGIVADLRRGTADRRDPRHSCWSTPNGAQLVDAPLVNDRRICWATEGADPGPDSLGQGEAFEKDCRLVPTHRLCPLSAVSWAVTSGYLSARRMIARISWVTRGAVISTSCQSANLPLRLPPWPCHMSPSDTVTDRLSMSASSWR